MYISLMIYFFLFFSVLYTRLLHAVSLRKYANSLSCLFREMFFCCGFVYFTLTALSKKRIEKNFWLFSPTRVKNKKVIVLQLLNCMFTYYTQYRQQLLISLLYKLYSSLFIYLFFLFTHLIVQLQSTYLIITFS